MQKRYPSLARRMEARRVWERRDVPGGNVIFIAAVVAELLLLVREVPEARQRVGEESPAGQRR